MGKPFNLPSVESYYPYSSKNYGVNSLRFDDDRGISWFFSYKTLIAVRINGKLLIRKNDWKTTTGKHLNEINTDKSLRVDEETFYKLLDEELKYLESK